MKKIKSPFETYQNLKKTWKYAKRNKLLFKFLIFSIFLSITSAIIPIITAKVLINITGGNFKKLISISILVLF